MYYDYKKRSNLVIKGYLANYHSPLSAYLSRSARLLVTEARRNRGSYYVSVYIAD